MVGIQEGERLEDCKFIFISFAESESEHKIYCRELLHKLFSTESVSCVCFDAQELLITIIGHLSVSHRDVYSGWRVEDVKVSHIRVNSNDLDSESY